MAIRKVEGQDYIEVTQGEQRVLVSGKEWRDFLTRESESDWSRKEVFDRLYQLMNSTDEGVALQAAQTILGHLGK